MFHSQVEIYALAERAFSNKCTDFLHQLETYYSKLIKDVKNRKAETKTQKIRNS